MQQAAKKHLSPAEYLALEDAAEYKSEYCQGEVFAMAGASLNHIRIVRNLSNALSDLPQSQNCEAFASDAKVWIDSAQLFTYPDLVVICGLHSYMKVEKTSSPIRLCSLKSFPIQPKIMIAAASSSSTARFRACANTF